PSESIAPPTRIFPADYAATDKMAGAISPAPAADSKFGPYDPFQIFFWQSEKEASLKDTLERWAGMAGVRLYWNAGSDYSIPKEIRMHGTFPDAVTAVLGAYGDSPDRPFGRLHPNLPNGPAVLIIQSSGSAKAVN
ncbi:MAG TPA: TcpQ domain-containing protein, partial [Alphaproteobacteria bacterium]